MLETWADPRSVALTIGRGRGGERSELVRWRPAPRGVPRPESRSARSMSSSSASLEVPGTHDRSPPGATAAGHTSSVPDYLTIAGPHGARPQLRRMVGRFPVQRRGVGDLDPGSSSRARTAAAAAPARAGLVACVMFLPSIVVAPAASCSVTDFRGLGYSLAAYALQALTMGATALALAAGPPRATPWRPYVRPAITLTRPAHGALLPEVVAYLTSSPSRTVASGDS